MYKLVICDNNTKYKSNLYNSILCIMHVMPHLKQLDQNMTCKVNYAYSKDNNMVNMSHFDQQMFQIHDHCEV